MKFVQIATAAYVNVDGESYTPVYALGDDGSVWEYLEGHRNGPRWRQLADTAGTGHMTRMGPAEYQRR